MNTHSPLPDGILKKHVLSAINALGNGLPFPAGAPTRWQVLHEGKRYPPKAVVGAAAFFAFGWPLDVKEFSSGEGRRQAVGYLRELGFRVVPKGSE